MSNEEIQTLDYYVNRALNFIGEHRNFKLKLPESRYTLVVGSQNAYWVGRLLYRFSRRNFSHAEEVQARYEIDTKEDIEDVTIVSATGSRDVVDAAQYALKKGLPVNAIVCNPDSELKRELGNGINEILVPTIEEPPTINTATYGMMIYGVTREDLKKIREVLQLLKGPEQGYNWFDSLHILLPDSMLEVGRMTGWKLQEIFGRSMGTLGTNVINFRHGAGVRLGERELYIGIGVDEKDIEKLRRVPPPPERMHIINVPEDFGPLGYLMVGYSVIGQIQKQRNDTGFQEALKDY